MSQEVSKEAGAQTTKSPLGKNTFLQLLRESQRLVVQGAAVGEADRRRPAQCLASPPWEWAKIERGWGQRQRQCQLPGGKKKKWWVVLYVFPLPWQHQSKEMKHILSNIIQNLHWKKVSTTAWLETTLGVRLTSSKPVYQNVTGNNKTAGSVHGRGRLAPPPGLSPPPQGWAQDAQLMPLPLDLPPSACPQCAKPSTCLAVPHRPSLSSGLPPISPSDDSASMSTNSSKSFAEGGEEGLPAATTPEGGRAGTTVLTACSAQLCQLHKISVSKHNCPKLWRLPRRDDLRAGLDVPGGKSPVAPHIQSPYGPPLGMLRSPRRKRKVDLGRLSLWLPPKLTEEHTTEPPGTRSASSSLFFFFCLYIFSLHLFLIGG